MQIVSDMYCVVSTPLAVPWCYWGQCSVIYVSYWTRAGPKSGKLPRFWILGLQRDRGGQQRPRPLIWMVGCEHGHHRHRHSLHLIGTTRPGLAWHNSILPCLDWLWVCGIQFLQSLHSPEKWNTLLLNILRKLQDYDRYDHEVQRDGRWNLILWPGGKCYH